MGENQSLFPLSLLTTRRQNAELFMRPLHIKDFERGYPTILSQLTELGQVSKELFEKRFKEWQSSDSTFIIVVEDTKSNKIAGAASLFVEKKLVHSGGKVCWLKFFAKRRILSCSNRYLGWSH
eukprot:TRINITY_DN4506_c0_g1_i2.p1 TRINITY_DN4506_c0_g1~~TRINITY_DN4506_c0_g1_i2.p1  ORF type:complete len:123 (-),score=30.76 TRINITY_DN4506_c0_g1_i2:456-824(-)